MTPQRVGILCQNQPVFTFLQSVLGWQALTTVLSRPAYGWGHWPWSAHEHVCGRSPHIYEPAFPLMRDPSFPQNRAVPLYSLFFLSLPDYCCLLITFSIISIYSGTDCKAWCHCKILLGSAHLEKTDRGGKTGRAMTLSRTRKVTTATLTISTWRFRQPPSSKRTCLNNKLLF